MEILTPVLDFLRVAGAVAVGVAAGEAALGVFVVYKSNRHRKKKLAQLQQFEAKIKAASKDTKGKASEDAEAVAEEIFKALKS